MIYYQYDPKTKKYLGSGKCQIDPIEKVPLYPRDSTNIEAPIFNKELLEPYFINNAWELKESDISKKNKLLLTNVDGIFLYKKEGDLVVEKTPLEIQTEKDVKKKNEDKIKAQQDLYNLKQIILDRVVLLNATKKETDLIKIYEDILKA